MRKVPKPERSFFVVYPKRLSPAKAAAEIKKTRAMLVPVN